MIKESLNHTQSVRERQKALEDRIAYNLNPKHCLQCNAALLVSVTDMNRALFQAVKRQKFCNHSCAASYTNNRKGTGKKKLHIPRPAPFEKISKMTKGEIFATRKSWQSARSCIRRHAAYVFEQSGMSNACVACGYTQYTEVCHKKPVSEFPSVTLVSEINHPNNLLPLCPNHHWEFDHGFLNLVSVAGFEPAIPAL